MNPAWWATLGAAAALLLVGLVTLLAVLLHTRAERRRSRAQDTAGEQLDALRARVDELTEELRRSRSTTPAVLPSSEFVITTAGLSESETAPTRPVSDRAVLSVTLGEPVVKLAALGYGIRRALSAESRNRISFEMRREVKRARKERRRAARRARPGTRTEEAA